MWMKFLSTIVCLFLFVLLVNPVQGVPYQAENWNDPDPLDLGPGVHSPPAGGENLWASGTRTSIPCPQRGPVLTITTSR